jgi:hypothetical protein
MNVDIDIKLLLKNIDDEIDIREKKLIDYNFKYNLAKKHAEELKLLYKIKPKYKRNIWGKFVEIEDKIIYRDDYYLPSKYEIPLHLIEVYEYMTSGGRNYRDLDWCAMNVIENTPFGVEKLKSYKKLFELVLDSNVLLLNKIISITQNEYLEIFS